MLAIQDSTIVCVIIVIMGFVIIVVVIGAVEKYEKKRLAELPGEISAAHIKAKKAATACLEMQKAAILAEASFSAADLDDKQRKSSDGPRETKLVAKTKAAAIKTLGDLKRLSVESVELSPTSSHYVNLRTYCWLAHAACEGCDPQLCQGNCQALDILNKIKLT